MSNPMETLFGITEKPLTEEQQIERYLNEGKTLPGDKKHKLDVFGTLKALDLKDRGYYDKLSDQEKKGFAPFVLVRWASTVDGRVVGLDEWWVRATNENFNKNLLNLNSATTKHHKLQWLMATTASPGMGKARHEWIGYKKKDKATNNKIKKFFIEQFPLMKDDEIALLMDKVSNKELRQYCKDLGYHDREIKKLF